MPQEGFEPANQLRALKAHPSDGAATGSALKINTVPKYKVAPLTVAELFFNYSYAP
jgi:hypothetical protein